MLNGDRPQPLAKGTLEQRPLAHLLIYAKERRLAGTMTLGEGAAELVFSGGMLTKVETPNAKPTGAAQTSSTIRSLFSLPSETSFAYFDKFDALPDASSTSLDPLSFVWHPIRDDLASTQVDAIVDRAAQTPLRVPASVDTEVFGFDGEENRIVAQMRDRATPLAELEKISARAKRVVYVLLVTKRVEAGVAEPATPVSRLKLDSLSDAVKSPSPPPSSVSSRAPARVSKVPTPGRTFAARLRSSTPAAPLTPDPSNTGDAARTRIRDRAAGIGREDYFQTLGVPVDAPAEVIRATFFTLAKQWHPD
ncbi:MAG: J domain-containing protein, partial [Polyangiaceae bacterium]